MPTLSKNVTGYKPKSTRENMKVKEPLSSYYCICPKEKKDLEMWKGRERNQRRKQKSDHLKHSEEYFPSIPEGMKVCWASV